MNKRRVPRREFVFFFPWWIDVQRENARSQPRRRRQKRWRDNWNESKKKEEREKKKRKGEKERTPWVWLEENDLDEAAASVKRMRRESWEREREPLTTGLIFDFDQAAKIGSIVSRGVGAWPSQMNRNRTIWAVGLLNSVANEISAWLCAPVRFVPEW